MKQIIKTDVLIIGAGASGLMCAATAGYRGRSVWVIDKAPRAGSKILVSGGGKCNFTNMDVGAENYVCSNSHFVKSALARFNSPHFIELIERHGIDYHERDHGQLFCNESAKDIVSMLLTECEWAGAKLAFNSEIFSVDRHDDGFVIETNKGRFQTASLVVATGGLSLPKLGASPIGYQIAEEFGVSVTPTRAGLVPFTWHSEQKTQFESLSGIAIPSRITTACGQSFSEALLFTHRGLSGPVSLQASNYWRAGEPITINLLPQQDAAALLAEAKAQSAKQNVRNTLSQHLPRRLVDAVIEDALLNKSLNQLTQQDEARISIALNAWEIAPNGTEGYRTAEVTLGGVDTNQLSSKTMEVNAIPGLFFIGEVQDVSGWLGGYNFQWAWASGYAAGQAC